MSTKSVSMEERLQGLSAERAKLLEVLLERKSAKIEITVCVRAEGETRLPTSGSQQRLWFIDQLEGGSAAYHIPMSVRMRGELDVGALQAALDSVVARHEALRTVFVQVDGEPRQEIRVGGRFSLAFGDLRGAGEEHEAQVLREAREEVLAPFSLREGPLIRGRLLQLSSDEHVLLITMHHIISDGWSIGVLIRELGELYEAHHSGRSAALPALPVQYADYAQWQRGWLKGGQLQEQLRYWTEHLRGAPQLLELPTDRPRPAVQSYRGASVRVGFDAELGAELKALARRLNVTLAMLLYTAWSVVLSRLSGQQDLVVGTLVANRRHTELEGLIGFFVNTLAVRVRLEDDPSVADLLERVKEAMLGAYAHQDAPFEEVVKALQPARSLSYSPVFQVLFVLQNAPRGEMQLAGLHLSEQAVPLQTSQFDLNLALRECPQGIEGSLIYASDLFEHATVQRWVGCLEAVLRAMAREPRQQVSRLPMMNEVDRRQVLELFNATHSLYGQGKLIHGLFEEQVQRTPDAVAVTYEGQYLTYSHLNTRANQLAWYLRARGVGPDQLVGICIDRSLEMVIGLLGILKAGAAYVPLDPNYPAERLTYMLKDAAPRVLLTQEKLKGRLPPMLGQVTTLDGDWSEIAQYADSDPDPRTLGLTSRHLAYVIYTSGSTGQPKGAMNEHQALINRLQWMQHAYRMSSSDQVLQKTPFSFDVAGWEFFWTLMSGARLVVARPQGHQDPAYLRDVIEQEGITRLHFVPSMLQIFLDRHELGWCSSVRHIVCSGEELPVALQNRCLGCLPQARLSNLYGPTEAAIDVTAWESQPGDHGSRVPIGRPIWNIQMYVLDRHGQPVPIGVAGEIFIGGVGVGRGYLNRPELTAERFTCDPYCADSRSHLYKTGDLGRWRADGAIEYLGRNDHQVKIRGLRIELGEIEVQLAQYAQVKESVVIAREDVPGEKRLVAYVIPRGPEAPAVEELRGHLKGVLPEYMVPNAFVMLERLPLSPNGKLDRRALPAPELGAYVSRQYEAPQGEVEELLAGIWQALLRVERVGRRDNFFELGGHSLLIVQMMDRLRRVGLSVELRRVFESPTLADLAGVIASEVAEQFEVPPNRIPRQCAAITPQMLPLVELAVEHIDRIVRLVPGGATNIQDIYPLVPLQEGILFHHLLNEGGGDAYIMPFLLQVSSRDRLEELIAALQGVIDRHDVLRTAVLWEQLPRPLQVVYREAILPVQELVLDPDRDAIAQIREWIKPERQRMNLRQAPLMRLQIAADAHGPQWYALLQLHHIIDDATSLRMVFSEVMAYLEGRAQQLPQPVPYRNHVAQALAYASTHDAEAFFRSKLADVDEPTAPFGLTDVHGDGSRIEEARQVIEAELERKIRLNARRLSMSAATLFHAAWGLVVAHTSGREDVVFGSVLLGRLQGTAGAQRILGMFINTLPLRLQLRAVTARELVEHAQRELIELFGHEQASLAVAQRCSGIVGSAPLFSTLLNYRHSMRSADGIRSHAAGVRELAVQERTNYPLTVSVDDLGEGFALTAQTDRRVDPLRITGYLNTAIQSLVQALEEAPQTPALQLPILPHSERQELFELFNATAAPRRQELVHELFEEQARHTPDAVAVTHAGQNLTYARLNAKANQLARYLLSRGVGPDQLVGVCLERSLEMVIGVLGILKAGGAYVPLDPNYPAERLAYMLEDSLPQVVLTQQELQAVLPATQAELVALDTKLGQIGAALEDDLSTTELGLRAQDLVYVIYTSGSTGKPKGTAMPHHSVVNLIEWHREGLRMNEPRRVLQFAALSFDVAFQEIFSTLCTGGTLVLLDEWMRRDARALMELLNGQVIERLFVPPLVLQSLADYFRSDSEAPRSLQDVITAGEQLRISPEISGLFKQLPACRLHNHYGPTETHVVTALTLAGAPDEWPDLPSIGRPIANTRVYVLDRQLQPVPLAVTGEIYIGGAGVARGYLRRAQLTSERFMCDPCGCRSQLYKTGDLGRWRADGTLEYLGRNDDQVKIRGYRIELGEIESQLAQHAAVKQVAVIVREDVPGEKRLVAYVTASEHGTPAADELRTHLKALVPEYMVPSAFVLLDELPSTPSGKLNRRALPAPELGAYANRQYEPPQGAIEEALAQIWQELLHVQRVGRHDNFFELGGHSLLGVRLVTLVQERLDATVPVSTVFRIPTFEQLAKCIESQLVVLEDPNLEFEEGTLDLGHANAIAGDA